MKGDSLWDVIKYLLVRWNIFPWSAAPPANTHEQVMVIKRLTGVSGALIHYTFFFKTFPIETEQTIAHQSNKSTLHVLIFDGFTFTDAVRDVKMYEFPGQIHSCCQPVYNFHRM